MLFFVSKRIIRRRERANYKPQTRAEARKTGRRDAPLSSEQLSIDVATVHLQKRLDGIRR